VFQDIGRCEKILCQHRKKLVRIHIGIAIDVSAMRRRASQFPGHIPYPLPDHHPRHLRREAIVVRLSFNQNAMSMAFAEGCKNEGTRTVGMIHAHCPEMYAVMVKENTSHG
jgi:hypothetical protein